MSGFEDVISQVMFTDLELQEARIKAERIQREALRLQSQHATGQVQFTISELLRKINGAEETPTDSSPILQVKPEGVVNEPVRPAESGFPPPPTGPDGNRRGGC